MRQIELCTNAEWLQNYGPLSDLGLESTRADVCAAEWLCDVSRRLEREFPDVETTRATGQRMLFHGWNGFQLFSRKGHGLGTFDAFTDDEWSRAETIAADCGRIISDQYADD